MYGRRRTLDSESPVARRATREPQPPGWRQMQVHPGGVRSNPTRQDVADVAGTQTRTDRRPSTSLASALVSPPRHSHHSRHSTHRLRRPRRRTHLLRPPACAQESVFRLPAVTRYRSHPQPRWNSSPRADLP